MALISCKECGKVIFGKASVCPHCGCSVDNEQVIPDTVQRKEQQPVPVKKKSKIASIALIVSVVFMIVGGILAKIDIDKKRNLVSQTMEEAEASAEEDQWHKPEIENWLSEYLLPDADFDSMANYEEWGSDGLWVAQNEFKVPNDESKHSYSVRFGILDNTVTVFYVTVDDEKVYSDMDAQWEYIEAIE